MKVLVVNAGSSSLKYQLFDTDGDTVLAKGNCERIGIEGSRILHKRCDGREYVEEKKLADHSDAIRLVVSVLLDSEVGSIKSAEEIEAIGHRVVHGGPHFTESVLATEEVLSGQSDTESFTAVRISRSPCSLPTKLWKLLISAFHTPRFTPRRILWVSRAARL